MKETLNFQSTSFEKLEIKTVEAPEILRAIPDNQRSLQGKKETELVFQAELNNGVETEREMVVPRVVKSGVWERVKEGAKEGFNRVGKFVDKHKLELGVAAIAGTTMACNIFGREITDGNFIAAIVNTLVWPVVGKAFVRKEKASGVEAVMAIAGAVVGFSEPWTGVVTGILAGVVGSGLILDKYFWK